MIFKKIGKVADLCIVCRGVRPFRLKKVTHKSKLLGYEKECLDCRIKSKTDRSKYANICRKHNVTVEFLISDTFPHLREHYREELRKDKFVDEDNLPMLTDEERLEMIREPFDIFIPFIEKRHPAEIYFDRRTIKSCLFTFIIPLLLIFSPKPNIPTEIVNYFYYFAIAFLIISSIVSFYYLKNANKFYLKNFIFPRIGKSVAPLKPTTDELEHILNSLKNSGASVAKYIKIKDIMFYVDMYIKNAEW